MVTAEGTDTWNYTWDTVPLKNGDWYITASAYDGYVYSADVTVMVTLDNPRNRIPTVAVTTHEDGDLVSGVVEIGGISSDVDGSVELVQISIGDNQSWVACMPDGATGSFGMWTYPLNTTVFPGQNVTVYFRSFDSKAFSEEISLTLAVREKETVDDDGGVPDDDGDDGGGGGGSGSDKSEQSTSIQNILIIVVIIIVVVVLLLVMFTMRRKREREEEEARRRESDALAPDIVRPAPAVARRRATPAEPVTLETADLSPSPAAPAVAPPPAPTPGTTLAVGAVVTPDRLLPKPGGTADAGGATPTPPSAAASGPPAAPVRTTKPVSLDYTKPDSAPFMVGPGAPGKGGAADKAEVYHDGGKSVWTPDMAVSRTAKEAESALEMLEKLNKLKAAGAISDEEYEKSKKRLLRKI
jgi:uncharacterized membrane protein